MDEHDIDYYSIWSIEDLFKNYLPLDTTILDDGFKWYNSYNWSSALSQTIQFLLFNDGWDDYVFLQIHQGCDVRGGYTRPYVFKVDDVEYFILNMERSTIQCECLHNFYDIEHGVEVMDEDGAYIDEWDVYKKVYVDDDGVLRCKECDTPLIEYAITSY